MEQTHQKRIPQASSTSRGIVFFSNFNKQCIITTLDQNGNFLTYQTSTNSPEFHNVVDPDPYEEKAIKNISKATIIFDIAITIISILLGFLMKSIYPVFTTVFFIIFASKDFIKIAFVTYHYKIDKSQKNKASKLSGAKNKVINAYLKTQKVPTIMESKKFSRCLEGVTINKDFTSVFFYLILALSTAFIAPYHPLVHIAICFALMLLYYFFLFKGWNKIFQLLVTSNPSDKELQVAINGIEAFDQMENMYKERLADTFLTMWGLK